MVCFNPIKSYYPILPVIDYHSGEEKRYIQFKIPQCDYTFDVLNGSLYYDYETRDKEVVFGEGTIGHFKEKTTELSLIPKYIDLRLPCGKCIGCHADKARNYATRAIHEYYSDRDREGCFVTLTFNEEMLRKRDVSNYKSISRTELSGFIKRLRERVYAKYCKTIRIFASGEYGEIKNRPHYHLLIYGFDFPDKYEFSFRYHNKQRISYFRSPFLESLWKPAGENPSYGFSVIGTMTQSSCQYVASYVSDKLDDFGEKDYKQLGIDKPFFYTPSKEGLGFQYFQKYYKEIYANGYCHWHNGVKAPIPGYYTSLLKKYDPDLFKSYKLDKLKLMVDNLFIENLDLTEQRLLVRKEALKMKYDKTIRSYEELSNLHNIYYRYLSSRYKNAFKSPVLNNFIFDLKIEDARKELLHDNNKYDYVFLDAFTPAKCPALWSVDFFRLLYEHLNDNGMILTYSNSASIRNAFLHAGFFIGKTYNNSLDKFMGTVAVKNKSLIKHELSEYDLGLLKTKAGIFYRDENLTALNEAIINSHKIEVEKSNLISSSRYIKSYKTRNIMQEYY